MDEEPPPPATDDSAAAEAPAPPREEDKRPQDQESNNYSNDNNDYSQRQPVADNDAVIGSSAMPPVFLGNLLPGYTAEQIIGIFERPISPDYDPIPVDRLDQKRGFCFVFLKDAAAQNDKERVEQYVNELNGM